MNWFISALLILPWLWLLHVLKKAELYFWRFLAGCVGLFLFMMVNLQPLLTMPLARCVSAIAGTVGTLTGTFTSYFKYGIIFITSVAGSMTMKIDMECSGIIEIMVFISLLAFFDVYRPHEKLMIGILGTIYLILCNTLRITLICLSLHFIGPGAYYVMHTFVGRIIFYLLSILMYFFVFTKPQIQRIKVGNFRYEHTENSD